MPTDIALPHAPKLDRNALVVRHNDLIESRHRLSVPERRFMLWLVSQVSKDDEEFKTYRISVQEFVEFAGLEKSPNYYARISEIANSLTDRKFSIKNKIKEVDDYMPWFNKISYNWGNGFIEATLNPALSPWLLQLKNSYTAITLEYALLLQSSYSGRIYDLLKQYEKIGERIIRIDDLREMLELGTKYAKYRDFRKRVLDISHKEINEKTDISFDWEGIKEGRKFASIRFTIRKEAPDVSLDNREESEPKAQKLYRTLCNLGIAEKAARSLIDGYDDERIEWHINEYAMLKKLGKANSTGWLVKGIKQDYRPPSLLAMLDEENQPILDQPKKPANKATKITDILKPATIQKTRAMAKTGFLDWMNVKSQYADKLNDGHSPENMDKDFIAFFQDQLDAQQ